MTRVSRRDFIDAAGAVTGCGFGGIVLAQSGDGVFAKPTIGVVTLGKRYNCTLFR